MQSIDKLWYKDAIIYQLHVKSFFDSNGDGYGDFAGLIQKLDYIEHLGVTCIWLLPFYPSPLRDDGYDIQDYENVNPIYGNKNDFKEFVSQAHQRGLRVITELVINHTSDQHPWFQAARKAPPGSPERNFYVWSDTDKKYEDVRIIFVDTEKSNWTWDETAKAFYWHRFFHHQPDLNFDNPAVVKKIIEIMRYWLDMGVDGMRLDAVTYLIERDGTTCDNLPETHAVLKSLRKAMDQSYEGRIFLAEANLRPKLLRDYFGDGDECHMAYNFPVMPQLYLALHKENAQPIIDIMKETPAIPAQCQWAIFLRNHDELTLEMVSESDRASMHKAYAPDPKMIINLGIRRRLSPLMEHSRPRIELMNSLLFSLPGTPIVYYGDEIGMGENIELSDRNGVRTPMQWSPAPNGGFSKAATEKLYAATIADAVSGFQSVNVEAQTANRTSLLHWMRDIIYLRKMHPVFGRGTFELIESKNQAVLSFLRRYEGETLLVLANLSKNAQVATVQLSDYKGVTPVELRGSGSFPKIDEAPYTFTMQPYAFYWLSLKGSPA